MWIQTLLIYVSVIIALTLLMHLFGAAVYDIRDVLRLRTVRAHPNRRQLRKRPLISVIVLAENHEASIARCLRSVSAGAYRKYEIIVIDNASTDATKTIVRQHIAANPKQSIRLVAKRPQTRPAKALLGTCKRHCHGELLVVISPTDTFHPQTLARAVVRFNSDPLAAVLIPRTTTRRAPSLTSLLQRYLDLVSYRARKFASASSSQYLIDGPALYTRQAFTVLLKAHGKRRHVPVNYISSLPFGNKDNRVVYAHDALMYVKPEASFDQFCRRYYRRQVAHFRAIWSDRRLIFGLNKRYSLFLRWVRLPLALFSGLAAVCIPLLVTYFVYLALQLQQPSFLIITWVILGILLLFGVWSDGQLRWYQKLGYTIGIPVTYLLFYILSFVQIGVFLRTTLRPRSA